MKKIAAFSGSNSKNSINYVWVSYVASQLENYDVKLMQLTDYEIPMYSIDIEEERGIPVDVQVLKTIIAEHDALIISVNEHNGNISAFFKNIIDWLSRADRNFLAEKKILLTSTSTGSRGAASALTYAKSVLPRFGAIIVDSFSFPSFQNNYDAEKNQVTDEVLTLGLTDVLTHFQQEIEQED